ncbi:MAG: leucine-rich repeat protein [Ruminococcus sp.]|nr:leucine-rich repeat protein [Ruminococcus sp.]
MKKNAIRRFLAGVGTAFLAVHIAAVPALASNNGLGITPENSDVTTFDDGILTYTVIDDSRFVEITSCISTATHVNVLPELDGYTISSIAEGAFAGCTDLQSVTLPNNGSLTTAGAYTFAECTSLKHITLPDSLTEIPVGMFAYCTALEEVTFGDSVTSIGDEAFRSCTALKEADLPETLTDMGDFVYYMCSSLESVNIPEGLSALGSYSFTGCVSLTKFHIPSTLEYLGESPFLGCMGLTDLTVEEGHPTYKLVDGILYSTDETILYFYPPSREDTTFTVPAGVIDIYDGAFFQCMNLQYVELPEGLLTIGAGAFDYCSGLTAVVIPESVTNIMSTAFADCTALERVTFVGAENETDGEGEALVIQDHAFYACDSLMEVVLPKRVSEIGEYAFGCTEVKDSSGNAIPTAVEGFMLRGFASAEDYISECDLSVGFSPRHFPWKTVVFWVLAAAVLIVIVFFAVKLVKKNMMTPEEKEALRQAKEEQKRAAEEAEAEAETEPDDGYESILGEDEPEESMEDDTVNRFRGAAPSILHQRGHSAPEENEK